MTHRIDVRTATLWAIIAACLAIALAAPTTSSPDDGARSLATEIQRPEIIPLPLETAQPVKTLDPS